MYAGFVVAHTKDELLRMRFELNMARISTLTHLVVGSRDGLKSIFATEGAMGEVQRATVVFLHATFEVALKSYLPKSRQSITFSGETDLDKALKFSEIDPTPFKPLYASLVQMAKRRNRILHRADLETSPGVELKTWDIADEWQLVIWLLGVATFYYRMRIAKNVASEDERNRHDRNMKAMEKYREFGYQLLALPKLPAENQLQAWNDIASNLRQISSILTRKDKGDADGS